MNLSLLHILATRWWMFDVNQPWYLLLLGLLIPVVYFWKTSLVPASKMRRWVSLALRSILVIGIVLALAGTRIVWKDKGLCVAFVIDQSQSIPGVLRDRVRDKIRDIVEKMEKDDQFMVVEFGGDSVLASLPSPKGPVPEPAKVIDAGHTDIARALRLAMATFPADRQKRAVLFSDGNQNVGDSVREARIAAANDVDVFTVLLGGGGEHEVMIDQVILPQRAQKDVRFNIRTVVSADQAQGATLLVTRDGRQIQTLQVQLKAGANVYDIPDKVGDGGFHEYKVTVLPDGGAKADTFGANNTAFGFVRVDGPGKVMVIRGNIGARDYITDALLDARINTDPGSPGLLPQDVRPLMSYDCVVLENVGRQYLTNQQLDALEKWVKDFGGGLVIIGGDDSFGPGGYKGTPLEKISPVEMDIKRKKHLASVAMAVMLDKSGSMGAQAMGNVTKMDLANQGAVETIRLMTEADEANVAVVDTEVKWMNNDKSQLLKMDEVNKRLLTKNVTAVRAGGGGIFAKTALDHAYRAVKSPYVEAMVRHVIMFADCADTDQTEDCIRMAQEMFRGTPSVTTSVIGLGQPSDKDVEFQKELARVGGGRFYITDDPMNLPRIFSKEAFIASRNAFIEKKEGIVPTLYDSPLMDGFRDHGVPRVYGYIGTTLKPRATLAAQGLEADDPLLAHWVIGLGKVVAYTSDTGARWGKEWVSWDGFAKFWLQTIRWAGRSVQSQQVATTTTIDGNDGRVFVDATSADGKPINNLQLQGKIAEPGSNEPNINVPLIQVAPGKYEGKFSPRERGTYMVNVVDQATGNAVDVSGAVLSYPPEFRDLTPNPGMMKRIAEVTGGQLVTDLVNLWQPKPIPVTTFWPLWDILIVAALCGLLIDVAWRRLNILDWFSRKGGPVVVAGAGQALGALKVIRTGRAQVEQQHETLRKRQEPAIEHDEKSAVSSPQADAAVAVLEPEKTAAPATSEPEPGDYRGKLLAAKKRAAEQIRDAQKKK